MYFELFRYVLISPFNHRDVHLAYNYLAAGIANFPIGFSLFNIKVYPEVHYLLVQLAVPELPLASLGGVKFG